MNTKPKQGSLLNEIEGAFKISKRGGSLQLTVPVEVRELLNLREGNYVKFFINKKHNYAIIIDKNRLKDEMFYDKDMGFKQILSSKHMLKNGISDKTVFDSINNKK